MTTLLDRSSTDYRDMLARILPPGIIWDRQVDRRLMRFLHAIGDEGDRVDLRVVTLVEEMDPRTSTELLDAWERVLGLPDPCLSAAAIPTTLADRRLFAYAKLISSGGHTAAYFIEIAAGLGVSITIDETPFVPFRAGLGRCGEPLGLHSHIFRWLVIAPAATPAAKREQLECLIEASAPAHTIVTFSYV